MTHYKMTSFKGRGTRGEIVRLVFAAAGVPLEDHRVERPEFLQIQDSTYTITWLELSMSRSIVHDVNRDVDKSCPGPGTSPTVETSKRPGERSKQKF